jgi:hypothetical protein
MAMLHLPGDRCITFYTCRPSNRVLICCLEAIDYSVRLQPAELFKFFDVGNNCLLSSFCILPCIVLKSLQT